MSYDSAAQQVQYGIEVCVNASGADEAKRLFRTPRKVTKRFEPERF